MPKPITNVDKNQFPSLVCNHTREGVIPPNQLFCCSQDGCTSDFSDCYSSDKKISRCQAINTLDACKRTDNEARKVCDWKDDYFCLSTEAVRITLDYARFPDAIKWMANRSKLEESGNVVACDNGTDYQLCNSNGTLSCGDMFHDGYNCTWSNSAGDIKIPRFPLGEVCESSAIPTITETITSIPDWQVGQNLALSTYIPLGIACIGLGIVATFLYRSRKAKKAKIQRKEQQIREQQIELQKRQDKIDELQQS